MAPRRARPGQPRHRCPIRRSWSALSAGASALSTSCASSEEADHCETGELGALLCREGLYSSHLTTWRRQREAGALAPHKRGPKVKPAPPAQNRLRALERENAQLRERLAQAETIIEVQKNPPPGRAPHL